MYMYVYMYTCMYNYVERSWVLLLSSMTTQNAENYMQDTFPFWILFV